MTSYAGTLPQPVEGPPGIIAHHNNTLLCCSVRPLLSRKRKMAEGGRRFESFEEAVRYPRHGHP